MNKMSRELVKRMNDSLSAASGLTPRSPRLRVKTFQKSSAISTSYSGALNTHKNRLMQQIFTAMDEALE